MGTGGELCEGGTPPSPSPQKGAGVVIKQDIRPVLVLGGGGGGRAPLAQLTTCCMHCLGDLPIGTEHSSVDQREPVHVRVLGAKAHVQLPEDAAADQQAAVLVDDQGPLAARRG